MNAGKRAHLRALSVLGPLLLALFLLGGCDGGGSRFHGTDISGANYGRDFALLDPDGKTRQLADFRGKVVMLFFGFIQCPDVCPTTLGRAAETRRLLGADGERLQIIFVTLDPTRDSPEILRAYTAAFDADILGLHTTPEKTAETAKAFRIYYRKVPTGSSYTIDHSAISYLYDPEGRLRLAVGHQTPPEAVAADVAALLRASSTTDEEQPR
ncbi:MAG: SCO family protein [Azoarcus sp.]|jgi:protein SCO1/2|nr:SCO family protein [Azoarcus sp.]